MVNSSVWIQTGHIVCNILGRGCLTYLLRSKKFKGHGTRGIVPDPKEFWINLSQTRGLLFPMLQDKEVLWPCGSQLGSRQQIQ